MQLAESETTKTTWGYFREKDHPIWGLLKTLLTAALVAIYLSLNATNFDSGEVRTVALTGFLVLCLRV